MAYDIGTARGVIELDYNGRGVEQAQKDVAGLEKSSGKTGDAFKTVGSTAGKAGLAIAGGLALAVNSAANFEQRMSAVKAVSGASEQQFEALRSKALQLGKDTQFSATEGAQAIEELAKAGLSSKDILNGAADATVNLAAAGEIALPEAATIASNAMNQFNLSAKDMVSVADNIAGAANASAIDVGDFGQSLQQVGAVAHLAGVNFHDTATAIALLGNAGIKGSDAGTALKTMFQRLQPTTNKQIDLMEQLNLLTLDSGKSMQVLQQNGITPLSNKQGVLNKQLAELGAQLSDSEVGSAKQIKATTELELKTGILNNAFYDQHGRLKDLGSVSQELQNSMKGMTQQQKQMTLQTLFGSDAIRAAAVLSDAGAKGFDKMAASMGKVSAADVAKTRMDNFKGSLEQMKGSLETAGVAIGTILLPPLRSLVDALTGALNAFLNLSGGTQKFIAFSLAGVAGVLLLMSAIIRIVFFIQKFVQALELVRAAMATTWVAALGPIALIIAAIAAVVAIIVILWKKNETFRSIVLAVWNGIKAGVMAVVNWFMGLPGMFNSAWNGIKAGVSAVVNFIRAHWLLLVEIFLGPLGIIIAIIRAFWPQIKAVFTAGLNAIKAVWNAVWHTFGPLARAIFALIAAIVRLGWTIIKGLFLAGLNAIRAVTSTVWHAIAAVIRAVWGVIRGVVSAGVNAVRSVVVSVWNAIRGATSAAWNAIRSAVSGPINAVRGIVSSAVNAAKSALSSAWNAARGITTSAWNGIKNAVSSAINGMMNIISGIQGRVTGALSGAASWLYNAGREIIQGLLNGIESMIGAVTDKINSVTSKIKGFLPGSPVKEGPLKSLNRGHAGKEIIRFVIDGIESMAGPLANAMSNTVDTGIGVPVSTAPVVGVGARPRGRTGAGRTGRARIVDGQLRLDKSGKAFITGLAMDADEDDDDYSDTLRRMG